MNAVVEWLRDHSDWMGVVVAISAAGLIASLLAFPFILVRLPADAFLDARAKLSSDRHSALRRWALRITRDVVGVTLILAGLAMLVLPGQGLLSIVLGLLIVEHPGGRRLARWCALRPTSWRLINAMRRRAGRDEFLAPPDRPSTTSPTSPPRR